MPHIPEASDLKDGDYVGREGIEKPGIIPKEATVSLC